MAYMKKLGEIFLALIGLLLVIWSFSVFLNKPAPGHFQKPEVESVLSSTLNTEGTLRVGDFVLPIEIADTPEERERGFSNREKPLSGHGILFVFEKPLIPGFWMKEMRFALDIIWIREDETVAGVERGVTPESYPAIFSPEEAVRYVLELRAGDADLFNIDVGTEVYLNR